MKPHAWQADPLADRLEVPQPVARLDRRPVPRGEHEIPLVQPHDRLPAIPDLACPMLAQRSDADLRERNRPLGQLGLGLDQHELAVDALQRPAHTQSPGVQVHVCPSQPQHLAAPQTGRDRHGVDGVQPILAQLVEHFGCWQLTHSTGSCHRLASALLAIGDQAYPPAAERHLYRASIAVSIPPLHASGHL